MLLVNQGAIQLFSHAAGTLLCVFLLAVLVRKHRRAPEDLLLSGLVAAGAVWHLASGMGIYLAVVGREQAQSISALAAIRTAVSYLAPAMFLYLSRLWAKARRAAVPYSRFHGWLAVSLAAVAAASLDPTMLAVASLAPPLCLLRFIYRFQILDFVIGRRVLFVFTLAGATALYLVVVRGLALWLASTTDVFAPLLEVTFVLGAAVTWLPMYEIITRFFSRQSRIYADFSKRVIEEAAPILDLGARAQYLVGQVGKMFELRRAALVLCADPPLVAEYGAQAAAPGPKAIEELAAWLTAEGHDNAHRIQSAGGFNYLFPLRYEDRLTGMLLADTSPRAFLDENETTLLGLCRQISLSIESCRLAESKIGLEKELLQQQHLATLGKVAATIAHEVKNPLASIKTLAQLMREDPEVAERYGRDLDYLVAETDRLNRSMQQLLTYSRPLPEAAGEVALSELLESTAEFFARESSKQDVGIERQIAPDLKLARADRQTVQQVVLNLLLNAVQASPAGGRVELEADREAGGRIRIRITDEGPGIPEAIREKIFEPFFTTKQQGTGLGLAIVRKNIRQLDGEFELQTPVAGGRGTSVSVLLPENGGR
jgi:signal transduction histidine kinase